MQFVQEIGGSVQHLRTTSGSPFAIRAQNRVIQKHKKVGEKGPARQSIFLFRVSRVRPSNDFPFGGEMGLQYSTPDSNDVVSSPQHRVSIARN